MKLYDANGEVRVGDIVRFNKKPCIVERVGTAGNLVTIVTMDERKYTLNVLPHQINCVAEVREEWEDE
jgi:NMD protein affecting ribosome stability and mRNA decay